MRKIFLILSVVISFAVNSFSFAQISGNAIFLNGENDGIRVKDINSSIDELTTKLTVEAWIYLAPPFSSDYPRIVDRSDNIGDDRYLLCVNLVSGGPSININRYSTSAKSITLNKWVHVAATYNGLVTNIYIDGELIVESQFSSIIDVKESDIYIGNNGLNNRAFHGAIDELRIWNRVRTKGQIQRLMNSALDSKYFSTIDSGLVAYWQFEKLSTIIVDSNTSFQIEDLSVNKNHGIPLGDPAIISTIPQTHILEDFSLLTPKNDETLGTITPLLTWQKASRRRIYYPIEIIYQLYISESYEFLSPMIQEIAGDTSVVIQNLENEKTYFWKVLAKNIVGDTLWSTDVNGFFISNATDVLENNNKHINDEFELSQNYPNPFNPTTMISYSLPTDSKVKIEITNMLGQSVGILVDDNKSAGFYETTWNAANLPSGIYLISIRTEGLNSKKNFTQFKKALLLK